MLLSEPMTEPPFPFWATAVGVPSDGSKTWTVIVRQALVAASALGHSAQVGSGVGAVTEFASSVVTPGV